MSRLLLLLALACSSLAAAKLGRFTIDENQGKFLVDGKPFQVLSGEMHYLRIPPEYWRDRLRMARAMGLNTIATYVFWNAHEPRPGQWQFTGGKDVARFVKTAAEEGLFVILRPGPYGCAEWEFGGFPSWLLKEHDLEVRSMDQRYLQASERYLKRLARELVPLQNTRGGPIAMVQFENEYGSYGKDKVYLERVRRMLDEAGFDIPKFTSDGGKQMPDGYLKGVLPSINGALGQEVIDTLRTFLPRGPFFVAEFYPGWLDHWGTPKARRDAAKIAAQLDWLLAHDISVNFYMFHGGTTPGFMNGANLRTEYQPQPTSYDFDAPLDESGRPTPKFFKCREVIAKYLPAGTRLPEVPATPAPIAIPPVELSEALPLFENLPKPVRSPQPLSMEDIGQDYGYILYRTRLQAPADGPLVIDELRDYALIYLDGERVAKLDRRLKQNSVPLTVKRPQMRLDILVENLGRINYGPELTRNRKGITRKVTFAGKELTGWEVYSLPLDPLPHAGFRREAPGGGPILRRGTFQIQTPGDTFLDLRAFGKGCVFVNGRNLGRYWSIGSQQTLYLPGVWMRKGSNQITVLDLFGGDTRAIQGLKAPILDEVRADAPAR